MSTNRPKVRFALLRKASERFRTIIRWFFFETFADLKQRRVLIDALSGVAYEFMLLNLPIAIYVSLESYAKEDWTYFARSPEWAIATIFLAVQSSALYFKYLSRTGLRLSGRSLGGFVFLTLIIVVASSVNAVDSLQAHGVESAGSLWLRLGLFLFSSALFFLMVTGGRYQYLKEKKEV